MVRTREWRIQFFITPEERDALRLLAQKHGCLKNVGTFWEPSVTRLLGALAGRADHQRPGGGAGQRLTPGPGPWYAGHNEIERPGPR
jgi:hypothetical protein